RAIAAARPRGCERIPSRRRTADASRRAALLLLAIAPRLCLAYIFWGRLARRAPRPPGSVRGFIHNVSQPEHVAHRVEAGGPPRHPQGGAQCPARQAVAALGAVDELEALAEAAEDHRVVADGVAGAQPHHPDLVTRPLAHLARAREPPGALEVQAARRRHRAPERERRAARRVLLRVVVQLDDRGLETRLEEACGQAHQPG